MPRKSDAVRFLAHHAEPGDLVLTLGCGDVYTIADDLVAVLGDDDNDDGDARHGGGDERPRAGMQGDAAAGGE